MTNFQGNIFDFPKEENPGPQDTQILKLKEKPLEQDVDSENESGQPEKWVPQRKIITCANIEVTSSIKKKGSIQDSKNCESNCLIETAGKIKDQTDVGYPERAFTAPSSRKSESSEPVIVKMDLIEKENYLEEANSISPTTSNLEGFTTGRFVQPIWNIADQPQKCDMCLYRSSIENWKPISGEIYCPKCQFQEAPLVRAGAKKPSSCGLLHCWPLCSISYLFPTRSQNLLHCAECFNFLGLYDDQSKCIWPNRKYIDFDGFFSAEESKRARRRQAMVIREEHC